MADFQARDYRIFETSNLCALIFFPRVLRNSYDEFGCRGFNTNSFLRFFGGLNKGRPNAEDLRNAEEFARNVKEKARGYVAITKGTG